MPYLALPPISLSAMSPRSLVLLAPLLLFAACATEPDPVEPPDIVEPDTVETPVGIADGISADEAVAVLNPTEGNTTSGRVTFTAVEGGVRVVAEMRGLGEGPHGLHIHETGDCSAPDGSSAGGHFAPDGSPHGAPNDPAGQRHAGDLGNIEGDDDGAGRYERIDTVLQMSGPASIIGRGVIVHAGQDDYTSQPTGDAGNRIACGVIVAADES